MTWVLFKRLYVYIPMHTHYTYIYECIYFKRHCTKNIFKFLFCHRLEYQMGLPQWLSGNESACNAGAVGSMPELGLFAGRGHGNPLQYSCLENPTDRGAWQATVHGIVRVGHNLVSKPPPLITILHACVCIYVCVLWLCIYDFKYNYVYQYLNHIQENYFWKLQNK